MSKGVRLLRRHHLPSDAAGPNVLGFLQTLSGRSIIPPIDLEIWPAREYLAEHRKEWRL